MARLTPERAAAMARRPQVAQDYLRGETQADIAKKYGVDQGQISRDLKAIQREWLKSTTFNLDRIKAKELARLDEIERAAWEGWRLSLLNAESEKKVVIVEGKSKIEKTSEGQSGNPRFMEVILRCIDQRCRLLGLEAPKRAELTGKGGKPIEIKNEHTFNPNDFAGAFKSFADQVLGQGVATVREDGSLEPVDPAQAASQANPVPSA